MKTARRQELRTNELAQQIDHVGEYVRRNASMFTAVVIGAAVIFGGGYWFVKHRQSELMDAWHKLSQRAALTDQGPPLEVYKSVAESQLEPRLTVQAWLKVGEAALMEHVKSGKLGAKAADPELLKKAADAYSRVLASPSAEGVAIGQALLGMGVIAENQGDITKAKEWYKKAGEDPRVKETPIPAEADRRFSMADRWAVAVVFPPPPPPPPLPEATSAPATSQASSMMLPPGATPAAQPMSILPQPAPSAPGGK